MSVVVFDSATLITCCQGVVGTQPIIEFLTTLTEVVVPSSVEREVVTAGRRYSDASIAAKLFATGRIQVENVVLPAKNALEHYKLGIGEKEAIALCLNSPEQYKVLVTDDRLAYVIAQRCGISAILFLDWVVDLVLNGTWDQVFGEAVTHAVAHRFSGGFVPHTLMMLRRNERKCLV
jgi:predicted nucleic acid-binding protein